MEASGPQVIEEMLREPMIELLDRLFDGPQRSIYCYVTLEGLRLSREFLESLPDKVQATYAKQFEKRCQGHHLRGDRWKGWTEDDGKGNKGVYEYKDIASKTRLIHLVDGKMDVLLFGFSGKKENDTPREHVLHAVKMKSEYISRRDAIAHRIAARRKK